MQSAFSWSAPRSPAIDQGALPIAAKQAGPVPFEAKQAGQERFTTENTELHEASRRSKAVSSSHFGNAAIASPVVRVRAGDPCTREAEAPESAPREAPIFPPRRSHTAWASSVLIPCFLAGVQPFRSKSASTNNPTTTVPVTGQRSESTP